MKRHVHNILLLTITFLVSSCESYLINGDLDGFWQAISIEEKETGNIINCQGDIYYSFQRELVSITYVTPDVPAGKIKETYIAYFDYSNDSITMGDFRIYKYSDGPQAPLAELEKFGLYETYTTFLVEKLDKNSLIMSSNKSRIVLKKY